MTGDAGAAAFIGADEIAMKQRQRQRQRGFTDPVTSIVNQQVQRELLGGYDDQRAVLGHRTSVASTADRAGSDAVVRIYPPDWVKDHHLGRDSAMVGGGTGLLGTGALYEGEKQRDATVATQQSENDLEHEYGKTYRHHEHELENPNWTPERSHTRRDSRDHKRGGLLGKILHRKSKAELQNEPTIVDNEIPNRSPTTARGPEDAVMTAEAGAIAADELKRNSSERKKHSPKPSGDFAHLGRNKLHKEPPSKHFQQRHAASSSGSDSPPTSSSPVAPSKHIDAEGMMDDPYVADRPVSGFGENGEYGGVVAESHTGFAMNGGNHETDAVRTDERYGPHWDKIV